MTLRPGQSLLELLAAFFVIAVGLFAAISLVYSNLTLVQRDADEIVAVNLAREGIEFAKNMRDSNWLAGADFDAGMKNGTIPGDFTATPAWEGVFSPGTLSLNFTADDFSSDFTNVVKTSENILLNPPSVTPPPGVTYAPTPYKRLLTLIPICFDDSVSPGTFTFPSAPTVCVSPQRKVGMRVESRVRWSRGGITKNIAFSEDLYDWR